MAGEDVVISVGADFEALKRGINEIAQLAQQRLGSLQAGPAGLAGNKAIAQEVGSLFGYGQSRITSSLPGLSKDEREEIDKLFGKARSGFLTGAKPFTGFGDREEALRAFQKSARDTVRLDRDLRGESGRLTQAIIAETSSWRELARVRDEDVRRAAGAAVDRAYGLDTPEGQARALRQAEARELVENERERGRVLREANQYRLQNPNLTATQRFQLRHGITFGRTNLFGDPATLGQLATGTLGQVGRFAVAGAGVYGVVQGFRDVVKEATELQVVMRTLEVQLNALDSGDSLEGIRDKIFDISTSTGVAADQVARLTSQFVGAFAGLEGDTVGGAQRATELATQLGVIGGIAPEEIFNDLAASMRAFAEEGTSGAFEESLKNIGDVGVRVSQVTGVPFKELADFLGRVGPIAATAGLSLEEAAAAGGTLLQGSALGGAALGDQFSRILTEFSTSALDIASLVEQVPELTASLDTQELETFNAALRDADASALFGLAEGFKTLSTEQQRQIVASIGSRREGQTLAALLQGSVTLLNAQEEALDADGAAAEEFAARMETFNARMKQLRATLLEIGIAVAESGLLQFVTDLARLMAEIVGPLAGALGYFNDLPEALREAAVAFGALGAAILLYNRRAKALEAGGIAGALQGPGGLIGGVRRGAAGVFGNRFVRGGLIGLGGGLAASYAGDLVGGSGGNLLSGILGGAAGGAAIGSLFPAPILGPVLGGLAGGILGGLSSRGKRETQQKQLEDLSDKEFDRIRRQYQQARQDRRADEGVELRPQHAAAPADSARQLRQKAEDARDTIKELEAEYPDLKAAVEEGVKNIAELPSNVANKLQEVAVTLDTALAEFEAGERTLSSLNQVFERERRGLGRVDTEESRKAAEELNRQQRGINTTAIREQFEFQEEILGLSGGDDPQGQLARLQKLRATPEIQGDPEARREITKQILAVQRRIFDSQLADLEDASEKLALINAGIPVDIESQVVIIEEQLASNTGAFRNFMDSYLLVGSKVPQELVNDLARIIQAGGDAKARLRTYFAQYLNYLKELGNAAFFEGNYAEFGVIADQIIDIEKNFEEGLGKLDFGVVGAPTITGTEDQRRAAAREANKDGAAAAKELAEARADLMRALIEGDPLAEAQFAVQEADRQMREAENEAGRVRAQAARIRADRQLNEAVYQNYISRFELAQALAESSGDVIRAAELGLELANIALVDSYLRGGGEAEANRLKAEIARATANLRETVLNEGIDDFQFAVDMGEKTQGEFVNYLRGLLELPNLTKDQRQEISRQIKQLEGALGQEYQFNLPTELALPTLYEGRRLDQTGGGYQDNRIITITLNAQNAVDGQAAVQQIVDVLNAPSRYGLTPRNY